MVFHPKAQISSVLYRARLLDKFSRASECSLTVFNYHRIRAIAEQTTDFNDEVFGPNADEFEEQIHWLKKNTRIISEPELLDLIDSERPFEGPLSMVTFDDGYIDSFTVALPILKSYGVPASFFITSDFIDCRRLGAWDLASYFIKKTRKTTIELEGKKYLIRGSRAALIETVIDRIKRESPSCSNRFLSELSNVCEVDFPSREMQSNELMTWVQIREAAASVVSIGSHTRTHPILSTLTREEQNRELLDSKILLEQRIGRPVFSLAYPVGGYRHFTEETKRLAHLAGYRVCYSFATGVNFSNVDRFDVRRISGPLTPAFLAAKARFPRIFAES